LDGAVGVADGELPVGAEGDVPVGVVDLVVVPNADGQEVVEVRAASVAPPDDVMQFAAVVVDGDMVIAGCSLGQRTAPTRFAIFSILCAPQPPSSCAIFFKSPIRIASWMP